MDYKMKMKLFQVYFKMVNLLVLKCELVIHISKPWIFATPVSIVIVYDIISYHKKFWILK